MVLCVRGVCAAKLTWLKACPRGALTQATWEEADIGEASLLAPLAALSPVGAAGETAGSQSYCAAWWDSSPEITAGRRCVRRRRKRRTTFLDPQDIAASHWICPRWQREEWWCVVGLGQRQGGRGGRKRAGRWRMRNTRRTGFSHLLALCLFCVSVIMWCKC